MSRQKDKKIEVLISIQSLGEKERYIILCECQFRKVVTEVVVIPIWLPNDIKYLFNVKYFYTFSLLFTWHYTLFIHLSVLCRAISSVRYEIYVSSFISPISYSDFASWKFISSFLKLSILERFINIFFYVSYCESMVLQIW